MELNRFFFIPFLFVCLSVQAFSSAHALPHLANIQTHKNKHAPTPSPSPESSPTPSPSPSAPSPSPSTPSPSAPTPSSPSSPSPSPLSPSDAPTPASSSQDEPDSVIPSEIDPEDAPASSPSPAETPTPTSPDSSPDAAPPSTDGPSPAPSPFPEAPSPSKHRKDPSSPTPAPAPGPGLWDHDSALAIEAHIKQAQADAQLAMDEAKRLLQDPKIASSETGKCLSKCVEKYAASLDKLNQAVKDLGVRDATLLADDFGAVEADISTCQACFSENIGADSPLKRLEEATSKAARECLTVMDYAA